MPLRHSVRSYVQREGGIGIIFLIFTHAMDDGVVWVMQSAGADEIVSALFAIVSRLFVCIISFFSRGVLCHFIDADHWAQ